MKAKCINNVDPERNDSGSVPVIQVGEIYAIKDADFSREHNAYYYELEIHPGYWYHSELFEIVSESEEYSMQLIETDSV
jgi:hypothetical protein